MSAVEVSLNGERREADSSVALREQLANWGYDLSVPMAVAVDERVLTFAELGAAKLAGGCRVEVITLQQGG